MSVDRHRRWCEFTIYTQLYSSSSLTINTLDNRENFLSESGGGSETGPPDMSNLLPVYPLLGDGVTPRLRTCTHPLPLLCTLARRHIFAQLYNDLNFYWRTLFGVQSVSISLYSTVVLWWPSYHIYILFLCDYNFIVFAFNRGLGFSVRTKISYNFYNMLCFRNKIWMKSITVFILRAGVVWCPLVQHCHRHNFTSQYHVQSRPIIFYDDDDPW